MIFLNQDNQQKIFFSKYVVGLCHDHDIFLEFIQEKAWVKHTKQHGTVEQDTAADTHTMHVT